MIFIIMFFIEGKIIKQYYGIVIGEVVMGVNIFKDLFVFICDIVGGCLGFYEDEFIKVC